MTVYSMSAVLAARQPPQVDTARCRGNPRPPLFVSGVPTLAPALIKSLAGRTRQPLRLQPLQERTAVDFVRVAATAIGKVDASRRERDAFDSGGIRIGEKPTAFLRITVDTHPVGLRVDPNATYLWQRGVHQNSRRVSPSAMF